MNKAVLKWVPLPAIAALLLALSPSEAQTARSKAQKPARAAVAQKAKPQPKPEPKPVLPAARRTPPAAVTYASVDPGCTTGRRRLWTEAGWMVRRVTSCR